MYIVCMYIYIYMYAHTYRATLRFLVRLFCKSDQISLPILDTLYPPDMIHTVFDMGHVCVHVCMYIHIYLYTQIQPYSRGISPIPPPYYFFTLYSYISCSYIYLHAHNSLHISLRTYFSTRMHMHLHTYTCTHIHHISLATWILTAISPIPPCRATQVDILKSQVAHTLTISNGYWANFWEILAHFGDAEPGMQGDTGRHSQKSARYYIDDIK